MHQLPRRTSLVLVAFLIAYGLYALAFIWRTSFAIDGTRYFSLFDDTMVSMRYARNLAHGYGLVWNPGGERVEGYTNLFWVLYMAVLHLLPVAAPKVSALVQLTGLAALGMNLVIVARLADRLSGGSTLAVAAALGLTAFYLPLNTWGLQGMEVSVLCLVMSTCAWLGLQSFEADKVPARLYVLLGLASLIRLDAVVPFLTVMGLLALMDARKRRQHLAIGSGVLVLALASQTAFRYLYYGDLLPNTYYLKMTGYPVALRLARGLIVFSDFALSLATGLLLLIPAVRYVPRTREAALLAVMILAQSAYSIYVGGDAWEWAGGANRYVAIAMPLLFALLASGLPGMLASWQPRTATARSGPRVRGALLATLVVLTVFTLNATIYPGSVRAWLLLSRSLHVTANAAKVETALLVRDLTTPQATVAVVWAGAQPYFMDRVAVDLLGKNDRAVARLPMRRPRPGDAPAAAWTFFYPGHLKYDYAYSIGQLGPDAVTELWRDPGEATPFLVSSYERLSLDGRTVFLRKGSPHIRWDRVSILARGRQLPRTSGQETGIGR